MSSPSASPESSPPAFTTSDLAGLNRISEATGSSVRSDFVPLCEKFLAELFKWNRKMNLVSRRDEQRIVERHVLDSLCLLAVEPRLSGKSIVDVGSGAGFPGLVLAAWEPKAHLLLVESRGKRAAFLKAARRALELKRVNIVHSRLEELRESRAIDLIVSRGVGDTLGLMAPAHRLLRPEGLFVLYKGTAEPEELKDVDRILNQGFKLEIVVPPWKTSTRLVVMRKLS